MIDAHCHLDDPRMVSEIDVLLSEARREGVLHFISAGYAPTRWEVQREIAERHPDVWITCGLHPWFVAENWDCDVQSWLDVLLSCVQAGSSERWIGLGELGLDRSLQQSERAWEMQCFCFREQLAIAREYDLPIVLHGVKAHNELLRFLKHDGVPQAGGIIHGFSGSRELAQHYTRLGLCLSIGGQVVHSQKLQKAIESTDSSQILIETDAPDVRIPMRVKTSNPLSALTQIVDTLSHIWGCSLSEAKHKTACNTSRVFGMPYSNKG